MLVPDDGFMKQPKHVAQFEIMSEKIQLWLIA